MKKYSSLLYTLTCLILIGSSLVFNACKKDDDPDPVVENTKVISSGTWTIANVKVDGVDQSDLFAGFTLQFASDGSYSTTNGDPVWPSSGTWSFSNPQGTTIARDDGRTVTVNKINNTELVLTMDWDRTILGGGRTASVSGEHVFTFSK